MPNVDLLRVGNPHAYDFYNACGFKIVGTTETRFGPGLLMRKMGMTEQTQVQKSLAEVRVGQ